VLLRRAKTCKWIDPGDGHRRPFEPMNAHHDARGDREAAAQQAVWTREWDAQFAKHSLENQNAIHVDTTRGVAREAFESVEKALASAGNCEPLQKTNCYRSPRLPLHCQTVKRREVRRRKWRAQPRRIPSDASNSECPSSTLRPDQVGAFVVASSSPTNQKLARAIIGF
jgi:hypothetical protein